MSESFYVRDKRKGHFFQIDNVIVEHYLSKVGVYAFVVYSVLVKHSRNGSTGVTHKTVAGSIRCSPATVKTAIDVLMSFGLLSVKSGQREGAPNTYFIMEPPAPGSTPTAPPIKEDEKSNLVFLPNGRVVDGGSQPETYPTGAPPGSQDETHPPTVTDTRGQTDDTSPILKKTENRKTNKTVVIDGLVLPTWLDREAWDGFVEMRQKSKSKPTRRALELILKDLAKFEDQGISSTEVLNNSVKRGWLGVFAPSQPQGGRNGYSNGSNVAPRTQRNRDAVDEVCADIDRQDRGEF